MDSDGNNSTNSMTEKEDKPERIFESILKPLRNKKYDIELALQPLCVALKDLSEEIIKLKNQVAKNIRETVQLATELLKMPTELWLVDKEIQFKLLRCSQVFKVNKCCID